MSTSVFVASGEVVGQTWERRSSAGGVGGGVDFKGRLGVGLSESDSGQRGKKKTSGTTRDSVSYFVVHSAPPFISPPSFLGRRMEGGPLLFICPA